MTTTEGRINRLEGAVAQLSDIASAQANILSALAQIQTNMVTKAELTALDKKMTARFEAVGC